MMQPDVRDELICHGIGLLIVFVVAWLFVENIDAARAVMARYGMIRLG